VKSLYWISIIVLIFFSCNEKRKKIDLQVGDAIYKVEIADNDQERQQGLMNRDLLPRGEGMFFVFQESRPLSFWMKNTLIPLSIAYIDESGVIIDIKHMEPLDESPVMSSGPVKYALEVNRGDFQYKGIKEGDRVLIPKKYQ